MCSSDLRTDAGPVTQSAHICLLYTSFYHGPEGVATPQTRPATLVDIGGYYKFRDPGFQLLFCYGHTAIGQTENYAYLGLYWTWGKKEADKPGAPTGAAFDSMTRPGLMGPP